MHLCGAISGSVPLHVSTSLPAPPSLDDCSWTQSPQGRSSDSPTLFFNFKMISALPVPFHVNLRIVIFTKDPAEAWVGVVLNLYINLERTDISTLLSLLIHEHGMSLHQFRSSDFFHECLVVFIRSSPINVLLNLHQSFTLFEGSNC